MAAVDLLHQVIALDEQGKAGTRHLEKIINEKNRVSYEGEVYTKIVCLENEPRTLPNGIEIAPWENFVQRLWAGEFF